MIFNKIYIHEVRLENQFYFLNVLLIDNYFLAFNHSIFSLKPIDNASLVKDFKKIIKIYECL